MRHTGRRLKLDTYIALLNFLNGQKRRPIPGLRDTYVQLTGHLHADEGTDDRDRRTIAVYYHQTPVVEHQLTSSGLQIVHLRTGGWRTVTTKSRMNQFSPAGVYAKGGQWFVQLPLARGMTEGRLSVMMTGQHMTLIEFADGCWGAGQ